MTGGEIIALAAVLVTPVTAALTGRVTWSIARSTHKHEADMRRVERVYDDRKAAYLAVIRWMLFTMQTVSLTEPILTYAGMPEPPEPPSEEEWRQTLIEVNAFGSRAVVDEFEGFLVKRRSFFGHVSTLRLIRQQGGDATQSMTEMQNAREQLGTAFDELSALIRDELASM